MSEGALTLHRGDDAAMAEDSPAPFMLGEDGDEILVGAESPSGIEPARALVPADFAPPREGLIDAGVRWAYRIGVPGAFLAAPLRKPARPRLLATVESPLAGDAARGTALRAGHFLIHGLKIPAGKCDFSASANHAPPIARALHGFSWLRDLGTAATREQCSDQAEAIFFAWLGSNREPGKGPAWTVERAGQRLLAWLVNAPLLLSSENAGRRGRVFEAIEETARWLDRRVDSSPDRLGALAGWCAIVAAGLLLPDGRPRRLFGEAGFLRALGEVASEDGGVLSRSPLAQMDATALLIDLRACYAAVKREPPAALGAMLDLLVPPLLTLRHGDGGLGSWQGGGAVSAGDLAALVEASAVRARPPRELRHWGYQRATAGKAVLQFDAAPPPRPRHARFGCASTLAFELSHGEQRIVVNCGGAEIAGGATPARIEQGLRASAAHSTLVLDDANSTAVLIKGQIGKGVEEVDVQRGEIKVRGRPATRIEAAHDGYASRFGLTHRRILVLSPEGEELRGEDVLEPAGRRGKRGKIDFAIRFHLAPRIEVGLSEDGRGAGLALPDGSYWQLRLGGDRAGQELAVEDSLWVDGQGRPRATQQLVIRGLTSRSGERFPWLLKRMG
ncbi:heparinase II/III family protein [Qipengyuania sp. MTN3-11]|uniref:heparinase II/III family protein n=1 Tax=Qipengyuania sp. MTN3-11 TaxID=3056557 RepID=UPI0036F20A00